VEVKDEALSSKQRRPVQTDFQPAPEPDPYQGVYNSSPDADQYGLQDITSVDLASDADLTKGYTVLPEPPADRGQAMPNTDAELAKVQHSDETLPRCGSPTRRRKALAAN
jgi:hypothetical protein